MTRQSIWKVYMFHISSTRFQYQITTINYCSHRRAKTSHARCHHGHVEEQSQQENFIGRRHNKNRQHSIAKTIDTKNDLLLACWRLSNPPIATPPPQKKKNNESTLLPQISTTSRYTPDDHENLIWFLHMSFISLLQKECAACDAPRFLFFMRIVNMTIMKYI